MPRALFVVDPQNDFVNGSLPVPDAEKAMNDLAHYLEKNRNLYALKLITLDWHPWNHASFQENGGQWPRHCVAFSKGAAIWGDLHAALCADAAEIAFLKKGEKSGKDEYSIFQNSDASRQIMSLVKKLRIKEIDICGLAGDVCVLSTLRDALNLEWTPKFRLLKEFSPSLDGGKALADFMERL